MIEEDAEQLDTHLVDLENIINEFEYKMAKYTMGDKKIKAKQVDATYKTLKAKMLTLRMIAIRNS